MTGLVKQIDKIVSDSTNSVGVVILMNDDKAGSANKLKKYGQENGLKKMELSVNLSGAKSPGRCKINPAVKHTIVVYEKKTVVENFALNKIGESETAKIAAAFKKLVAQ